MFFVRHLVKKITLISTACMGSASVLADENLNTVIVTANRYSQTVDDSLSSVTVITREDIEKTTAQDLPALLGRVAGIDVRTSGAYGKNSSIFMRGTNSNHVLTLVDGVKLYSATLGSTSFQHLALEQIEHIEIVRGPRASVYGSEAIGGVIQIFTRKGAKKSSAQAKVGYGSNASKELAASFSGATDQASFNLTARSFKTDGIDAIRHTSSNDKDGYTNDSIGLNFNYTFNDILDFKSSFMNAQGNTQFDNCFNTTNFTTSDSCRSDFVQQTLSNTLNITPSGIWDGKLQIGTSRDFNDNFFEFSANGTFETNRDDVAFINNLQFTEQQLIVLGLDYAKDTVDTTAYDDTAAPSRDNFGLFAAWNGEFDQLNIEFNLRRDDNEQFNTHNTGSIAFGYPLTHKIKASISYATAFKAPTFNELYFPFFGLPALKPEDSKSVEVGVSGQYAMGRWSLNIYQTIIDNLISFDQTTFLANNIDKSQLTGAELISNTVYQQWAINTSLSYVDPVNKSDDNYNRKLQGRAKTSLSLAASRQFGRYHVGSALLMQSKRYQNADNTRSTSGYGVLDLSMDYAFTDQFKLSVKLNNIFDKDYALNQTFSGDNYNTLGRNFFASLVYKL